MLDGDRPRLSGPLSLRDAVETALRGNFDVQAVRFEADAAHEETSALRAMTRPQISANTYVSSGDMRNILGTPPGSSPANALTVPTRRFVDQNLTLMVPLYTGGKLGNLVKAASQRESAVRAFIGEAEADAALMVREAYIGSCWPRKWQKLPKPGSMLLPHWSRPPARSSKPARLSRLRCPG